MANAIAERQAERLVAVVGIAHMEGIETYLMKAGYDLIQRKCN